MRSGGLRSALESLSTWLPAHGPTFRRRLLLGLVIAVPVAVWPTLDEPFNAPKLILLFTGVALVAALRIAEIVQGADRASLGRLLVPAVAFSVPFTLAWAASPNLRYATLGADYGRFQGLLPYLFVVAFGLLVADAFDSTSAEDLVWALATAGTIVAGYAVIQYIGGDVLPWTRGNFIPISTLGNSNFTGGFIAISLPLLIPYATRRSPKRRIARKLLLTMVVGLVLSNSQGAWLAAAGGSAVSYGLISEHRWPPARTLGLAVAGLALVISLGTPLVAIAGARHPLLATARSRGFFWQTAVAMAADRPLFGHGLNSFGEEQAPYRSPGAIINQEARGTVPDDPHSVPLAMMANAGLIGIAGWMAVWVWFVIKALPVPGSDATSVAFVAAGTAYFLQSLVSIDEVALRFGLWVCLGGLAAAGVVTRKKRPARREVRSNSQALRAVVGTALGLALIVPSFMWAAGFIARTSS